jgi:hypothetical protein
MRKKETEANSRNPRKQIRKKVVRNIHVIRAIRAAMGFKQKVKKIEQDSETVQEVVRRRSGIRVPSKRLAMAALMFFFFRKRRHN